MKNNDVSRGTLVVDGTLVVNGLPGMTKTERHRIAYWLEAQAKLIRKEPCEIETKYTARIWGLPKKDKK